MKCEHKVSIGVYGCQEEWLSNAAWWGVIREAREFFHFAFPLIWWELTTRNALRVFSAILEFDFRANTT